MDFDSDHDFDDAEMDAEMVESALGSALERVSSSASEEDVLRAVTRLRKLTCVDALDASDLATFAEESDMVATLVEHLSNPSARYEMWCEIVWIFGNLSACSEGIALLMDASAPSLTMDALAGKMAGDEHTDQLFMLWQNLASDSEHAAALVEQGAISALISNTKVIAGDSEVLAEACGVLRALLSHEGVVPYTLSRPVVDLVFTLLPNARGILRSEMVALLRQVFSLDTVGVVAFDAVKDGRNEVLASCLECPDSRPATVTLLEQLSTLYPDCVSTGDPNDVYRDTDGMVRHHSGEMVSALMTPRLARCLLVIAGPQSNRMERRSAIAVWGGVAGQDFSPHCVVKLLHADFLGGNGLLGGDSSDGELPLLHACAVALVNNRSNAERGEEQLFLISEIIGVLSTLLVGAPKSSNDIKSLAGDVALYLSKSGMCHLLTALALTQIDKTLKTVQQEKLQKVAAAFVAAPLVNVQDGTDSRAGMLTRIPDSHPYLIALVAGLLPSECPGSCLGPLADGSAAEGWLQGPAGPIVKAVCEAMKEVAPEAGAEFAKLCC